MRLIYVLFPQQKGLYIELNLLIEDGHHSELSLHTVDPKPLLRLRLVACRKLHLIRLVQPTRFTISKYTIEEDNG